MSHAEQDPLPPPGAHRAHHAVLQQLIEMVREAYEAELRLWIARKGLKQYRYKADNWTQAWRKMASFYAKHEIVNCQAYVHAQFEARAMLSRCPTPQQCYGPKSLEHWQRSTQGASRLIDQIGYSLTFQRRRLRGLTMLAAEAAAFQEEPWTDLQVQRHVLLDSGNDLSPLFRYCVSDAAKLPDVMSVCHDAALLQYLLAKDAYDQVWAEGIPQALRAEAAAARALILAAGAGELRHAKTKD